MSGVKKVNVKELIEELKKHNEKQLVMIESRHASYHFHVDKVVDGLIDKDLDELIDDKRVVLLHEGKQIGIKKKEV